MTLDVDIDVIMALDTNIILCWVRIGYYRTYYILA